ncbi:hypothetical protein NEOKW01_1984 [Nematocida sp. AWRm80]|nr:hypothetical protein NEOKW01_1984 [Nematocida sp. AWRm80]
MKWKVAGMALGWIALVVLVEGKQGIFQTDALFSKMLAAPTKEADPPKKVSPKKTPPKKTEKKDTPTKKPEETKKSGAKDKSDGIFGLFGGKKTSKPATPKPTAAKDQDKDKDQKQDGFLGLFKKNKSKDSTKNSKKSTSTSSTSKPKSTSTPKSKSKSKSTSVSSKTSSSKKKATSTSSKATEPSGQKHVGLLGGLLGNKSKSSSTVSVTSASATSSSTQSTKTKSKIQSSHTGTATTPPVFVSSTSPIISSVSGAKHTLSSSTKSISVSPEATGNSLNGKYTNITRIDKKKVAEAMKQTNAIQVTNIAVYYNQECDCYKDANECITMKKVNGELVDSSGMFKGVDCQCKTAQEVKDKSTLTQTGFYQVNTSESEAKAQADSVSKVYSQLQSTGDISASADSSATSSANASSAADASSTANSSAGSDASSAANANSSAGSTADASSAANANSSAGSDASSGAASGADSSASSAAGSDAGANAVPGGIPVESGPVLTGSIPLSSISVSAASVSGVPVVSTQPAVIGGGAMPTDAPVSVPGIISSIGGVQVPTAITSGTILPTQPGVIATSLNVVSSLGAPLPTTMNPLTGCIATPCYDVVRYFKIKVPQPIARTVTITQMQVSTVMHTDIQTITKEMPVTHEVPVTKEVQITREVPVTKEVPTVVMSTVILPTTILTTNYQDKSVTVYSTVEKQTVQTTTMVLSGAQTTVTVEHTSTVIQTVTHTDSSVAQPTAIPAVPSVSAAPTPVHSPAAHPTPLLPPVILPPATHPTPVQPGPVVPSGCVVEHYIEYKTIPINLGPTFAEEVCPCEDSFCLNPCVHMQDPSTPSNHVLFNGQPIQPKKIATKRLS